jgi:hypothetical protein
VAIATDPPTRGYHGFVVYTWDEDPVQWDYEVFALARALGAGWIQAEGPLMLSESAHWGRLVSNPGADLDDPASYDFDRLAWVEAATEAGLDVVLTLSTGNDQPNWNTYSPWVDCSWTPQNIIWENACNCLPRDWNEWYRFVFQVVRHFNGVNGPSVRVFQTIGEPGNVEGQYFQGSAEEMYGGGRDVTITRHDGTEMTLSAAVVPVTRLAVHDANPIAQIAIGAPYGGVEGSALAAVNELYSQLSEGGFTDLEKLQVVEEANRYGFFFVPVLWWFEEVTFQDIETWLFDGTNNPAKRGREFVEVSIRQAHSYDIYGFHLYDSDYRRYGWLGSRGIARAMAYIGEKLGGSKPVWVNGTGLWGNLYHDENQARSAYHLIQTLVGSYAAGMDGLTYTGISDGILLTGPISLYENRFDPSPPRGRHEAAGAFSLLARLFPVAGSFELLGEFTPDPPDDDVLLYAFRLRRALPQATGFAAIGWCLDEEPDPYTELSFDNPDCPKPIDVGPYLGVPPGTELVVYNYDGSLMPGETRTDTILTFAEAPFVMIWGDDTDGDRIPDVGDNCPRFFNPDQSDTGDRIELDGELLEAPDGVGDACLPAAPRRASGRVRP